MENKDQWGNVEQQESGIQPENEGQENSGQYQFIREKVISKRKKRLERMGMTLAFTVFLAIVFGVVARAVFLYADAPLRRIMGIGGEAAPSPTPTLPATPTGRPSDSKNPAEAKTPGGDKKTPTQSVAMGDGEDGPGTTGSPGQPGTPSNPGQPDSTSQGNIGNSNASPAPNQGNPSNNPQNTGTPAPTGAGQPGSPDGNGQDGSGDNPSGNKNPGQPDFGKDGIENDPSGKGGSGNQGPANPGSGDKGNPNSQNSNSKDPEGSGSQEDSENPGSQSNPGNPGSQTAPENPDGSGNQADSEDPKGSGSQTTPGASKSPDSSGDSNSPDASNGENPEGTAPSGSPQAGDGDSQGNENDKEGNGKEENGADGDKKDSDGEDGNEKGSDGKDSDGKDSNEKDPNGKDGSEGIKDGSFLGYAAMFAQLQEIATQVGKSLVTVTVTITGIDWLNDPYEAISHTTGIVIEKTAEHLLVLLNLDRIQSASSIQLAIDGESFGAELWNYDKDYNLAVVAVESSRIPERYWNQVQVAEWGDSASLAPGTPILALGNPNGYIGSMEFGMVTSSGSTYYIMDNSVALFNTNTTDSESGDGVIVDLEGKIIGLITRTMKSDLNESMCTAVGISNLENVLAKLAAGEKLISFGILGEDIPASVLEEEGIRNGIYVMEVIAESPAFDAGVKTGDIILLVGDEEVRSYSEFNELLNLHETGDSIRVTIRRTVRMNPQEIVLRAVLEAK